ncbi:MAG: hypothetical protein ACE149_03235 [Armatimonadota bacterium]
MRRKQRTLPAADPEPSASVAIGAWLAIALALGGLALWYLAGARKAAGEFGLPLDDGWIHARFAQNLAAGRGFSFNPGEATSTTTSPLWTLLLALGYRITHEYLFTGIAINLALALALLGIVYRLALSQVPSRWLALSVAGVVAATVPLPWWVLSGMEPPLYATLALLGILLHLAARGEGLGRELPATAAFGLAALARPEMLLLFPLALLDRWLSMRPRSLTKWLKGLAASLPLYAIIVAPLFLYNHQVTGYWLPTSYYSKLQWRQGGIAALVGGAPIPPAAALVSYPLSELGAVIRVWTGDNAILGVLVFVGSGWSVWRWRSQSAEGRRSLLIPMLLVAQPVAWALAGGYRPPEYQSQRYIADLNPLFALLGMVGGWWATSRLSAPWRGRLRVAFLAALLAASLVRQPEGAAIYARNVKNTAEMQVAIGRWLKANAPPDSLLAVNDIGAIGLISGMRVLDLQGLVTPEILPLRSMRSQLSGTAPQQVFDFIVSRHPDYLIIFPRWYPELAARTDLFTQVHSVRLPDNITNGADEMVVYRTAWARQKGGGG